MGKDNSKRFLGLCAALALCVVGTVIVLCVVWVRGSNTNNQMGSTTPTPDSSKNNETTYYPQGVQEYCDPNLRTGPRCIEANLTAGECYDIADDRGAGFFCVGDNVTYKNLSGVVYRETLQDILEELSVWGSTRENRRNLVDFQAGDLGVTFVDIEFMALQCRKTTMEWDHSTPRSSYLNSYAFYEFSHNGSLLGESLYEEGASMNYYENEYEDYSASHRVMLLDWFAKDIAIDRRGFGAVMDVWPDTTDCYYEVIVSSGGISTDQWDANLWSGNQEWYVSWPSGVGVEKKSGAISYCEKHFASFHCSVPSPRSGVRHKNTFAVIAPTYEGY